MNAIIFNFINDGMYPFPVFPAILVKKWICINIQIIITMAKCYFTDLRMGLQNIFQILQTFFGFNDRNKIFVLNVKLFESGKD